MAAARCAGLPDLKMPDPTKTPSAPSCIIIAASAGVAIPPAVNSTTRSRPAPATPPTSPHRAGAGLALGPDHRRPRPQPPKGFAEVGGATHERNGELPLVDVVGVVGRR